MTQRQRQKKQSSFWPDVSTPQGVKAAGRNGLVASFVVASLTADFASISVVGGGLRGIGI